MPSNEWTDEELEASVEAYLLMLRLEIDEKPYNKSAIRRALLAGPLNGRTTSEQRMQNISAVLEESNRRYVTGYKPLHNVGTEIKAKLIRRIDKLERIDAVPRPLLPPAHFPDGRKLPPTGYWIFVCNRGRWNGEGVLREGQDQVLYPVSGHNAREVQVGDVGVLRLNALQATKSRAFQPAGIYALIEVLEAPSIRTDIDARFHRNPEEATKPSLRALLRITANLVDTPVASESLPADVDYNLLRRPLQTSTIPLSRRAFIAVVEQSGVNKAELGFERQSQSLDGIRRLEQAAHQLDPRRRERISGYIERGPIGAKVKAARMHRCQICDALAIAPVSFMKRDGRPYSEAHHVQPVSHLVPGSLGENNIMVLCANHHRQAHFGEFEVLEYKEESWSVSVDGHPLRIARTKLF